MDRLACVDLPALPLQLLMRHHPTWRTLPAAVVDEDRPQGTILWVNEAARGYGILPGLRYAQGLALSSALRASIVSTAAIDGAVDDVVAALRAFTPHVQPAAGEPGVLWLDASGLGLLYPSLAAWAGEIRRALGRAKLIATVVVGFQRFGTYAVARASVAPRITVFAAAEEEAAAARAVPLSRVGVAPEVRDALLRLGVVTIGDFARLPAAGLRRRFGPDVARLHRAATGGDAHVPLQPRPAPEPLERALELDEPELDLDRLVFLCKQALEPLLRWLAEHGQALGALEVRLGLHDGGALAECLRPAAPTLDSVQILGLLHLRLETLALPSGVTRLVLAALGAPATAEQLALSPFVPKPKRDREAAARALARLRARFGEDAVVHARLREGHLPEARFSWEPMDRLPEAHPRAVAVRPRVRRLYARPRLLPPRERREPDGWLPAGLEHGPVERLVGPYRLSGGWWRTEVQRDYHFAELRSGECLWIYFDRRRRRWYVQGVVG